MEAILNLLIEGVPLIAAAIVPIIVAGIRKVTDKIPANLIPVILPVAGGLMASIGTLVGAEVSPDVFSDDNLLSAAINGILVGSAAVGFHQIKKQRES